MHQRFVIAVFVAGAELQVAVEKQSQVVLPAGQHDALIGRSVGEDDFVGIELFLGQRGNPVGGDEAGGQRQNGGGALTAQPTQLRQLRAKQPQRPSRHQYVEQPEQQTGAI